MSHVLRCSGYELVKTDMARAKGCHLYDAQGKAYVGCSTGACWWDANPPSSC